METLNSLNEPAMTAWYDLEIPVETSRQPYRVVVTRTCHARRSREYLSEDFINQRRKVVGDFTISQGRLRGARAALSIYLLDSNTCVEYLRNRNRNVVTRIGASQREHSVCRLSWGASLRCLPKCRSVKNLALLRRFIGSSRVCPSTMQHRPSMVRRCEARNAWNKKIGPHDTADRRDRTVNVNQSSHITFVNSRASSFEVRGLAIMTFSILFGMLLTSSA